MGTQINFKRPDGNGIQGYLANLDRPPTHRESSCFGSRRPSMRSSGPSRTDRP